MRSVTRISRLQRTYMPATHLLSHNLHTYIQPTLLHTLHPLTYPTSYAPTSAEPTFLHTNYTPTQHTQTMYTYSTPKLLHTYPTNTPAPYIPALPLHAHPIKLQTLQPMLHTFPIPKTNTTT